MLWFIRTIMVVVYASAFYSALFAPETVTSLAWALLIPFTVLGLALDKYLEEL
jgi:hypothetical protein